MEITLFFDGTRGFFSDPPGLIVIFEHASAATLTYDTSDEHFLCVFSLFWNVDDFSVQ